VSFHRTSLYFRANTIISYRLITAPQLYSLIEEVSLSTECVAHTLLVSYSQNSRQRAVMSGLSIVPFAESDFGGVATGRIREHVPHFPKDQFWALLKSDKKSARLLEGIPLGVFDFGYKPAHVQLVFL